MQRSELKRKYPEIHRKAQIWSRGPEIRKEAQRCPGRPRDTRRGPEMPREAQRYPKIPKEVDRKGEPNA
jgi:hypothetical protein